MTDDRYYVQCVSGNPEHIMEAVPGSELEVKCKARAEAGYIDALPLNYDDCPECVEESREQARRDAKYLGCPMEDLYGNCPDDCSCKNRQAIADSPYADQVQYITAVV